MRVVLNRLASFLASLALLLGSVGHHHRGETLSHGTFLFSPDHPAHAPFVPEPEHPCVACALAALSAPTAVSYFQVPPLIRSVVEVRVEGLTSSPDTPLPSGRSPPLSHA